MNKNATQTLCTTQIAHAAQIKCATQAKCAIESKHIAESKYAIKSKHAAKSKRAESAGSAQNENLFFVFIALFSALMIFGVPILHADSTASESSAESKSQESQNLDSSAQNSQNAALANISQDFSALQSPVKISIQSIDEKSQIATIAALDLRVGETGIVRHRFDSNYEAIIAYGEVVKVDSSNAYVKLNAASILPQKYLPTPTNKPSVGDDIHFRTTNNLAFLIAPDLATYEDVRAQERDISFLNSDLMMGFLFDYGGFDPKPDFLHKVCEIYSAGLLYVVTEGHLNALDCQSLVVLARRAFDTSSVKESVAPFFSRVQYASSGSLDSSISRKKSRDYFSYYRQLITLGNDFKKAQ
ncbi:hypothetical protein BKN38_01515 [Helicobacter sp. CLO-3]|uniref:plasminogen-binding N-terminal domain-containing protein n=1 Tax=unclassified Helicobacter TaxID=2593540 RepID=UPI0008053236|nr:MULTISPECIES: plasminogen-binding N-terminal domain-containing protein [unclassified Helicobacter]OBV29781.1 hypothetical protein BA723_00315 [Helicobacter sp. CLO-3]OHU85235.1 hypothetical protein BKN38_01515 [Helicobacter sp. CLO-3]